MQTQLGLGSVIGWRVRQAADQGVASLLHELGEHVGSGLINDPTVLRAIEAAIRLQREDLVAPSIAELTSALSNAATFDATLTQSSPHLLGCLIDTLSAITEHLEGPAADLAAPILQQLVAQLTTRVVRVRKMSEPPDDADQTARACADEHEAQLVQMIDFAPSLMRALSVAPFSDSLISRTRSAVRSILQAVAGIDLHRLSLVGGHAQRITLVLEATALLGDDPRRKQVARSAIELFDEIVHSRLYISGAIAQQPHGAGSDIVRPFGATHIDGISRPCTTLGWVRALVALRPVMATVGRHGEVDAILELVTHNALIVAVGTDPTRWFGPVPHGIDRAEEMDLFGTPLSNHRFAPGPWRPSMRSGGVEEQCCAVSALLGIALIPSIGVHHIQASVIEIAQLTPGETTGDGWELTIAGEWPFAGELSITVRTDDPLTLRIRVPDWHQSAIDPTPRPSSKVRELPDENDAVQPTMWLTLECNPGVTDAQYDMPPTPRLVTSHPMMSDIKGCVAMMAGPFVFCLEGADQMGHLQPRQVRFDADGAVTMRREVDHPESYPTIHATGDWHTPWTRHPAPGRRAYGPWEAAGMGLPVDITFVPYYSIANRGFWDMAIWIPLATSTDSPN